MLRYEYSSNDILGKQSRGKVLYHMHLLPSGTEIDEQERYQSLLKQGGVYAPWITCTTDVCTTVGMIRCRLGTTTTHVSILLVKVIQFILTKRDILYPYG